MALVSKSSVFKISQWIMYRAYYTVVVSASEISISFHRLDVLHGLSVQTLWDHWGIHRQLVSHGNVTQCMSTCLLHTKSTTRLLLMITKCLIVQVQARVSSSDLGNLSGRLNPAFIMPIKMLCCSSSPYIVTWSDSGLKGSVWTERWRWDVCLLWWIF